ncbi:tRNA-splicing endonuclease subunit Sen2 [Sabethes cyaneus]|uniref:tRNA-splicing endonuclease subunit Sen2 n=1 Tax=Sabethes cyaneus TaxID=53552 RepID=UPI00237E4129|nr:tRNA-splicing endonuclease subunit Sen2 [Sabethes cyaneus]
MKHNVHPYEPKPKRFIPARLHSLDPLPVLSTVGDVKFDGTFTGLSVEVINPEAIRHLSLAGGFGQGTRSRSIPVSVHSRAVETVRERQLERRREWQKKYGLDSSLESAKVRVIGEDIEEKLNNGSIFLRDLEESPAKYESDPFPVHENLSLMFEEAMFLVDKLNCLNVKTLDGQPMSAEQLLDKFSALKPNFLSSYAAYIFFKSKNWVIKSGLKFGGDYILYQKGPQYFHASFIALIQPYQDGQQFANNGHYLDNYDFQCFNRIAETTAKNLLVLEVHYPTGVDPTNYRECMSRLPEFKVSEIFPRHYNCANLRSNQ